MTVLMLGLTRKRGAVAEEQVFAATPSRTFDKLAGCRPNFTADYLQHGKADFSRV